MVRRYTAEPVDPTIIDRALDNATRAPNAGFSQGWAFLRLDRPDDVRRFWAASTDAASLARPSAWLAGLMTAPVVIVPCSSKAAYLERYAEPDKGWTERDETRWAKPFWHMDAAMASLLILQTATDAGLGACFFGVHAAQEPRLREEFAIPADHDPVGVITIGHRLPDEEGSRQSGSPTRRRRRPWREVVHEGRWQQTGQQTGQQSGRQSGH